MRVVRQNCGEKGCVTRHSTLDRKSGGPDRIERSIERRSRQQGQRLCREWLDEDVK